MVTNCSNPKPFFKVFYFLFVFIFPSPFFLSVTLIIYILVCLSSRESTESTQYTLHYRINNNISIIVSIQGLTQMVLIKTQNYGMFLHFVTTLQKQLSHICAQISVIVSSSVCHTPCYIFINHNYKLAV